MKELERLICYIFVSTLKNFLILELPEPSTDLMLFPTKQKLFLYVKFLRPIAHQSRITFFLYTLHIDNTFRTCDKEGPDKKPRARLIYITIGVNQI